MGAEIQVTFDCADPAMLAEFWAQVLRYEVQGPPLGFATWDEALDALGRWRRAAMLQLAALASAAVGMTLAGVASMLWAVGPVAAPWLLVTVPALPLLIALGCHLAARSAWAQRGSSMLREQWAADLALLRSAAQS